jgi:hypothetical protein
VCGVELPIIIKKRDRIALVAMQIKNDRSDDIPKEFNFPSRHSASNYMSNSREIKITTILTRK